VDVSGNVIWVTSHGPCGEHVQQLQMFAMPQYVVTLVIKPRNFSPVGIGNRRWLGKQVVRGLKCYHPSMKWIRWPITELRHILAVYIMCPCDLDLWPIFTKIGSRDRELTMNICAYFEFYSPLCFWKMGP